MWVALIATMIAAAPSDASAQFGWVKKVFGKDEKKKPAALPHGAQPNSVPTPGAQTPAAAAPAQAPAGAVQAPVGQPGTDAAAQAALLAQKKAEQDSMIAEGIRLDAQLPQTLETAKYRLNYWEALKLAGVTSIEVVRGNTKALQDVGTFQREDSVRRAGEASAKAVNAKLEQGTRALNTRDLAAAELAVDEVLAGDPTNQRAQFLKDRIVTARRADQFRKTLMIFAAAAIAVAVIIGVFARKIFKRGEGGGDAKAGPPAAAGRKILVKVVDGIGRGKLLPIESDVFRIGAAASDKPEEHNDLIISDADARVSRFHCSIIRRGKDYFIVDSSLNGTSLNDKPLERGEHRRLRDGDDVTIADVSRVKFLAT